LLRAIHDFKAMVSPADYARLMDFMYIDSKEKLDEFSKFVKDLGVKKIQGEPIYPARTRSDMEPF
jgi:hypothetical protein